MQLWTIRTLSGEQNMKIRHFQPHFLWASFQALIVGNTTLKVQIFAGITLSGETFANFANFGLFRESLMHQKFEIIHSQKLFPQNSFLFSLPNFWKIKDPNITFFWRNYPQKFQRFLDLQKFISQNFLHS